MNASKDSAPKSAIEFVLRGEFIAPDALIKATGLASSGGAAKQMIVAGMVEVDGLVEGRRSCKIRADQVVTCSGVTVRVVATAASHRLDATR